MRTIVLTMYSRASVRLRCLVSIGCGCLLAGVAFLCFRVYETPTSSGGAFALLPAQSGPERQVQVSARIADLKVISYYPAANGWTRMWTNWQPDVLNRDFARMSFLGTNTVRVVVFPDTFGWPQVSATMASRFAGILAIAKSHNLGIQLTLFDRWGSYSEVAESRIWLHSLLQPYAANPEIRLVELKNEVDPSDTAEVAWLRAMLPSLRSVLPRTPITVSVSGTAGPSGFVRLHRELNGAPLDVADMHFYGNDGTAYSWMLEARHAAGSLPLFIGEIGYPVEASSGGEEAAEMDQAHWFDVVFTAARAAGVATPAPWILNDFEPNAIPGQLEPEQEYHFGLYSVGGQARPSASVVEHSFKGLPSNTSNLNFERVGSNHLPMVWSTYLSSQGTFDYSRRIGRLGSPSVSLSKTRIGPLGAPSFYLVPVDPVISHQLWTASVWARGIDVNGKAQIALAWHNSNNLFIGDSNSLPLPRGNPGWTKLSVRTRVPADATSVDIYLKSYNIIGTVWFSDVQISVSRCLSETCGAMRLMRKSP